MLISFVCLLWSLVLSYTAVLYHTNGLAAKDLLDSTSVFPKLEWHKKGCDL